MVDVPGPGNRHCRHSPGAVHDELRPSKPASNRRGVAEIHIQWSSLYPWGVYALAFGQLGQDFDSATFKILNTIMTVLVRWNAAPFDKLLMMTCTQLLLNWLFCLTMTIPRMISGEVFLSEAEEARDEREKWSERRHLRETAGQRQGEEARG